MRKHGMEAVFLLFFVSVCFAAGDENEIPVSFDMGSDRMRHIDTWKYRLGDGSDWMQPKYDDSSWMQVDSREYEKESAGIHYYRTHLVLMGEVDNFAVLMFRIHGLNSAFELYWDGVLVGQNGKVGADRVEEVPGGVVHMVKLKHAWTPPGEHTVAIRCSNYHGESRFARFAVSFGYAEEWMKRENTATQAEFVNLGLFAVAATIGLAIFLIYRRYEFLFFTVINILNFIFSGIFLLFIFVDVNIQYVDFIDWSAVVAFQLSQMVLLVFFLFYFSIPKKWLHISINVLLFVSFNFLIYPPDQRFTPYDWFLLVYLSCIFVYAIKKRMTGSLIALMGYLVLLMPVLVFPFFLLRPEPLLSTLVNILFMFCIIISIFKRMHERNRLYEATRMRSHRLETELLKKTIQPHFIMNTLVSIISLISEDPKKAVKLIKALAEEFRVINRVSSETLIPIREEIDLCRTHLDLMGLRMDAEYDLITSDIDEEDRVPPLLFHTLVENGLTHAFDVKECGRFFISYERTKKRRIYRVRNDGSLLKLFVSKTNSEIEEGLGLHYVRARLEESFSSGWFLDYGVKNGEWEVQITIES